MPRPKETLNEETRITSERVEEPFRFKPVESRTYECKFKWLYAQEEHVLTPCVSIELFT